MRRGGSCRVDGGLGMSLNRRCGSQHCTAIGRLVNIDPPANLIAVDVIGIRVNRLLMRQHGLAADRLGERVEAAGFVELVRGLVVVAFLDERVAVAVSVVERLRVAHLQAVVAVASQAIEEIPLKVRCSGCAPSQWVLLAS